LEDRFAMVPEWVLDADIGDCALRLYAVLLRYGNTTGARMPARATLATRLHKKSVDTVDRALAELVGLGAVQVEHRWDGRQRLTNRYRIRTTRPQPNPPAPAAASASACDPSRTDATTREPTGRGGRTNAATCIDQVGGGRTDRDRVAARIGHDRHPPTETPPPPPPPPTTSSDPPGARGGGGGRRIGTGSQPTRAADPAEQWRQRQHSLLASCGIADNAAWDQYVAQLHAARHSAGQPLTRWSRAHLLAALDLAVRGRGWPADRAADALLHVAADPATRSPARLAEAGPWWDCISQAAPEEAAAADLADLEAQLGATDGRRVILQQLARQELARAGQPVTRRTVLQTAVDLLHTRT